MIIKKVSISKFGGLKNYELIFDKGVNLIYGENEKGKSTTEIFIKVMLYGFSKKKIAGESERVKYMPFDETSMGGELTIEHNCKEYTIKRIFGLSKKDDKCLIIDAQSGEEINDINKDEPGKYFLGINKSTFEKTLFISQLGVIISKDKEEEIMDRITTIFGCGEEEVPVAKAIEKLEAIQKSFVTVRGAGELDLLKKKEKELVEEYYEGNIICEKNLKWEEELYSQKINKKELEESINKLDIYKKYIKKSNLQKEYREITNYLRKSEELKKKEELLKSDLIKGEEVVNERFINSLKEDYIKYCNAQKRLYEIEEERNNIIDEKKVLEGEIEDYKFIGEFGENLKDKLISIKYEQISLEEKINENEKILIEITSLEKELDNYEKNIGNLDIIKEIKEKVEVEFDNYEKKLYEMKSIAEKRKLNRGIDELIKIENIKIIGSSIGAIASFGLCLLGFPQIIFGIVLLCVSSIFFYKSYYEGVKIKSIKKLSKDIKAIESNLNNYCNKVGVYDYKELLTLLRKYKLNSEKIERIKILLSEKRNLISEEKYLEYKNKYNKNNLYLSKLIKISGCFNIEELVEKINEFDKYKVKLDRLIVELEGKNKNYIIDKEELINKENEIRKKLKIIELENIDLNNIEKYLNQYIDKIKRYKEIQNNIESIEETYKVLLKDRNIEEIKEDLKDIIDKGNPYSFNSEEEVDIELKAKNKELVECEKLIKDLENNISNRFIGKRNIVAIEEELASVREEIIKKDKKYKALKLSIDILKESLGEVRRDVGPKISKEIANNFKELTNNKYVEVLLGDKYEMVVRDNKNLFKGSHLSNGAMDQLYLSLRIAFINLLFPNEEVMVILDDALIQYDDNRRMEALKLLVNKINGQLILFTCQNIEKDILNSLGIKYNYKTMN